MARLSLSAQRPLRPRTAGGVPAEAAPVDHHRRNDARRPRTDCTPVSVGGAEVRAAPELELEARSRAQSQVTAACNGMCTLSDFSADNPDGTPPRYTTFRPARSTSLSAFSRTLK